MAGHRYVAHVTRAADGELRATFPAFPELIVRAASRDALERDAANALAEHIDTLLRAHDPVALAAGIDFLDPADT